MLRVVEALLASSEQSSSPSQMGFSLAAVAADGQISAFAVEEQVFALAVAVLGSVPLPEPGIA